MSKYIDRDMAEQALIKEAALILRKMPYITIADSLDRMIKIVQEVPAADVAPVVHGELTEHIHELLRAEQDGRLVVLPCKVGDTLWVIGRDNVPREMELEAPDIRTVCTDEDNLCMSTCNRKPDGFCAYRLRNDGASIGKTVFLTREEAEKALEARKNG